MASTFLSSLSAHNPLHLTNLSSSQTSRNSQIFLLQKHQTPLKTQSPNSRISYIKCTSDLASSASDNNGTPNLTPDTTTLNSPETFPLEKRRRSEILRERRPRPDLVKREPPNFEVGWRRTKEINIQLPKGHVIMDFLDKLVGLMDREFGSTELLAKAGEIVAERAREEAEVLRDEGEVEERMVTELFRVLKLMEMDLAMVKAAVKEETLSERLEQAKARCRQAILVANSF